MALQQVDQATQSINLQGSAQMIAEFFHFGINSILYQRGVYPADGFGRTKKYGLTLLVSQDEKLLEYLKSQMQQIEFWLSKRQCRKLVLVIFDVATKSVLERWQFDVKSTEDADSSKGSCTADKTEKKIQQEMSDVIRQITASVTFLPLLETDCSFDVLIYTKKDADQPDGWGESGPCHVMNGEEVQLKSFSTGFHKVDTKVSYKADL